MTKDTPRLNAFPVFMRVEGEAVVIVGDGDEALAKARLLGQSSARLRIVAAEPEPDLAAWIAANGADACRRRLSARPSRRRRAGLRRDGRRDARSPRLRGRPRGGHSGQRRRPAGTLRLLHAGDRQPRAGRRRDRHGRRRPRARADRSAPRSTSCCRRRWARSPRWRHRFRDAAERLLPKGSRAPPLLERFLRRRAGARHGGRPCRRGAPRRRRTAARADAPRRAMSRWSAPARAPRTC